MEFEDSRNALFVEPNAYIQKFDSKEKNKTKKIVFQEPYECMPNYYLNNDFKKGDCDCVHKKHNKDNCEQKENKNWWNVGLLPKNEQKTNGLGFELKNLMPLLGLFNKSGGANLGQIVGLLNNSNSQENGNVNPINLVSGLFSNNNAIGGILNLFKSGGFGMFNKSKGEKKEIKTTDFEIKNYTRVE